MITWLSCATSKWPGGLPSAAVRTTRVNNRRPRWLFIGISDQWSRTGREPRVLPSLVLDFYRTWLRLASIGVTCFVCDDGDSRGPPRRLLRTIRLKPQPQCRKSKVHCDGDHDDEQKRGEQDTKGGLPTIKPAKCCCGHQPSDDPHARPNVRPLAGGLSIRVNRNHVLRPEEADESWTD